MAPAMLSWTLLIDAALLFSPLLATEIIVEPPEPDYCTNPYADKQIAADTLAEAIKNFADLTLPHLDPQLDKESRIDEKKEGELDIAGTAYGASASGDGKCKTESCRHCSGLLLDRLKLVGMINDDEKQSLSWELNATTSVRTNECKRIHLNKDEALMQQQPRLARDADPSKGKQYTLSCVKAGERLIPDKPWIGLCDMCWSWRKLPEGLSPQFLNEVTTGDRSTCLGNHGICRKMYRKLDATETTLTGGTKTKTIGIVRSVECNIKPDSDLLEVARGSADFDIIIKRP